MLLRNKLALLLVVVVALAALAGAQAVSTSVQSQSQNVPPSSRPQSQPPAAAPQQPPATQDAPNRPGNTVQIPNQQQGQGTQVERQGNDQFVIRTQVENIILHATVIDDKHRVINSLTKNDFQIFENVQLQKIMSFDRRDVPVAVGIVIDNSGSMRDKRPAVNQAALNLVRASNQQDKVFIVNFNSEPYLDQDFTANVAELKDALDHIDSRGGTALYDSVAAASDHLMKMRDPNEKKVILIVTDGEDNASTLTLEKAVQDVAVDGGPTIYTIGILGGEKEKRARRALRILAEETGGVAFFPKDISEVDSISRQIAHDIRNQYILQYQPTTAKAQGGYRMVKVTANAPGFKHLQVRTRSGYYANQKAQQSASK
jgi:Ca-activated chloride channel homolog